MANNKFVHDDITIGQFGGLIYKYRRMDHMHSKMTIPFGISC